MYSYKLILALFFCGLLSCKQTIEEPVLPLVIKTNLTDFNNYYLNENEWGIREIIPLNDNSFVIYYRIEKNGGKLEHFDENFNLIGTLYLNYALFSEFNVNANNDIISSSCQYYSAAAYHFLKFNTKSNLLEVDSSPAIDQYLRPYSKYIDFRNGLARLTNGNYVFALSTADDLKGSSSRIIMASYADPIKSGIPLWVNRKTYNNIANEIYDLAFLKIATDNANNFYILSRVRDDSKATYCVLRKHSSNGELIWQTKFGKIHRGLLVSNFNNDIIIEDDRILVGMVGQSMYIFDFNGNVTEKPIPNVYFEKFQKCNVDHGYIAISDSSNSGGQFAQAIKFDRNFNLQKTKVFGSQKTRRNLGFAKLSNGKFVVSAFVDNPNQTNMNQLLFKMDENLEYIK